MSAPAKFDRRVTIQEARRTRDASGGWADTWSDVVTVWAGKRFLSGARLYAAESRNYLAELAYRIRHRHDIRPGMRLIAGDDVFEILVPIEIERRQYLDLPVRGLNQTPGSSAAWLDAGDGTTLLDAGDSETEIDVGVLSSA